MQKGKLIKNNNRVILLITFAQTVALYPGVSFWCMSDSELLAQGHDRMVASGRCRGRWEEEQKGGLDERFLCIWAQVELDNSHSDRQWYLGQDTTLYLLLPSISLCFFTPSLKPLDHAKSVWLRTLGCHSLGFGVCNSIRATTLKADVFHSLYLSSWRCLCQPTDAGFYISKLLTCQSRSFTPLMLFASEDCTSVPWSSY